MSGVRLLNVKKKLVKGGVDCLSEWLCYDVQLGTVTRVYKLKSLHNFSPSFVNGFTVVRLKRQCCQAFKIRHTHLGSKHVEEAQDQDDRLNIGRTPIGRASKPLVCSTILSAKHYSATATHICY